VGAVAGCDVDLLGTTIAADRVKPGPIQEDIVGHVSFNLVI
jgi:hypothetical protein